MSMPGLYRGTVVSDTRPTGTLQIKVPAATGTKAIKAISARVIVGFDTVAQTPTWYRYGIPPATAVWVLFEQGDVSKPVVIGLL